MDNTFERKNLEGYEHDALFHRCIANSDRFVSIAKLALGEDVAREFDWNTARREGERQVGAKLRELRPDFMFSVLMTDTEDDRYRVPMQVEHKSYKDSGLMHQLFRYQIVHNDTTKTPLISIVVYHGKEPSWRTIPTHQQWPSWANDEYRRRLINLTGRKLLNFDPCVLDLRELVRSGRRLDGNIDAVVYLLAEIWDLDEAKLKIFFEKATRLSGPDRVQVIIDAKNYVLVNYPNITVDTLERIENEAVEDPDLNTVLTFRNVMAKEWEEARAKGHEEIVLHMAGQGMESDEICKMTGLNREFVEQAKLNGKG